MNLDKDLKANSEVMLVKTKGIVLIKFGAAFKWEFGPYRVIDAKEGGGYQPSNQNLLVKLKSLNQNKT